MASKHFSFYNEKIDSSRGNTNKQDSSYELNKKWAEARRRGEKNNKTPAHGFV